MPDDPTLTRTEFAQQIKAKYPAYASIPDEDLASRMLDKYPEYKDRVVDFKTANAPESWSDWAIRKTAEWLPAIGGTVGGIAGATGGPITAIGGATLGAGAGEAYKQLLDRARGKAVPSTPTGAAENVTSAGIWQSAAPEAVGAGTCPLLKAGATRLMQSAVKPTLAAAQRATGGTPQIVKTLLEQGITVTKRG